MGKITLITAKIVAYEITVPDKMSHTEALKKAKDLAESGDIKSCDKSKPIEVVLEVRQDETLIVKNRIPYGLLQVKKCSR